MASRQKKFVLAVALAASAVLGVTIYAERQPLMLEWWRWRAIRECQSFDPDKPPPPAWQAIFKVGAAGYPTLTKLLCDRDPKVQESAWKFIDAGCGSRRALVEYLRRNSTLAAVSYLLPDTRKPVSDQKPGSQWRVAATGNLGDSDWYFYWSGEGWTHLEPSPEAIDFLESRLGAQEYGNRAVDALATLLKPGEVTSPQGPLATRIVKILARAGRQDSSVEAVRLLALRSAPPVEVRQRYRIPSRSEWTDFSRGLPLVYSPTADYQCREALLSLCHFDDVWTLMVIARLLRNPEVGPALKAILAESPRLGPLEMPRWLPHLEAARRFFTRSRLQRCGAATFLAEENLQDGKSLIQEAMAGEADGDLTLYYRSCLLVLGDETQRESVGEYFKKRVEQELMARSGNGPPSPMAESRSRLVSLARNLLLSGDRAALELVVSLREVVSFELGEFIDGFLENQDLAAWWAASKDRIAFDPARRKFFTR